MEMHRTGRTVAFSGGISVLSWGSIGGKLEGQGPLGSYFDEIETDSFCGQASWEKAESIFQQRALGHALERGGMGPEDVELVLAGDLLNQCAASNFALRNQPFSVACTPPAPPWARGWRCRPCCYRAARPTWQRP